MKRLTPVPALQRLEPYTVQTAGRRGCLRLDFNEHTIGPSPRVLERLATLSGEDLARYPDEQPARAAVARHFGFAANVDFVLTSGADEAIRLVCDGYVQAGDTVIVLDPGYAMYRFYATLTGATICAIPFTSDFRFPRDRLLEALHAGARLAVFGDPHNPTGTAVPAGLVAEVARTFPGTLLLVDEAYAEFSGRTSLALLSGLPNLLVARTFSKAFGLAGLRIGLLAGHQDTVSWLARMRSPYAVNVMALGALEAALEDPEWAASYADEVRASRVLLRDGLARLGIESYPSEANFVLARFGPQARQIREALRARGVLVRERRGSPLLEGTLRISVGTRADTERFLGELTAVLNSGFTTGSTGLQACVGGAEAPPHRRSIVVDSFTGAEGPPHAGCETGSRELGCARRPRP